MRSLKNNVLFSENDTFILVIVLSFSNSSFVSHKTTLFSYPLIMLRYFTHGT